MVSVRVVAAVTGLLAVLGPVVQGDDTPPPAICCMADQVQLKQVYTYLKYDSGNYNFGDVVSNLAYDVVNEREVYRTTRHDNLGPKTELSYYMMYQEKMMYVHNNGTGACIKSPLSKPFPRRCVPGMVPILDQEVVYGAGSGPHTTLNAFRAMFHTPRSDGNTLTGILTVTPDCVPILEELIIVTEGGIESETTEFTNMKIGPIPECAFKLPPACDSAFEARPMISQQCRGWKDKEKNRDNRFLHPWVVGVEGDGFGGLILETVINQGQICHE
ncbi:hypothetical protein ACOMHN_000539 [Nucella lapillus]